MSVTAQHEVESRRNEWGETVWAVIIRLGYIASGVTIGWVIWG